MKKSILTFVATLLVATAFSQSIATGYTVGTWSGFRTSAATFTFDDGCANQITYAVPVFDKYGYKASFYPVINWGPNWTEYAKMVKNGHEIGSHSVTHPDGALDEANMRDSKSTIESNLSDYNCVTITYPNCVVPDKSTCAKYYIGGRICSQQINSNTPSDYFEISSIICGSQGSCSTTDNFKTQLNSAVNSKGWAVFLIHEIDNGSGYSPTSSSVLDEVLAYVQENDSKIWVTTFRDAILYAKERDALSLSETTESSKIELTASVNITSTLVDYTYPITVRRVLPDGWSNFAASTDDTDIEVKIITVGSTQYAQFDVIPGKTYSLENRESQYTSSGGTEEEVSLENLISNGEFDSGTSGWQTQTGGDAQCTMTATTAAGLSGDNAVQLCPNGDYGTENWHIQMYQNVTLEASVDYTLSFSAKGATARKLYVMVQKIAADYDTYFYKEYSLTTTGQDFEETITTPADVAADSKVTFCIGGSDGCVYIDNVFFGTEKEVEVDDPQSQQYSVDVTDDISAYFVDKAYIGPSCDVLDGEEITDGAYYTGEYRNLFTEILGKTQAQVDSKIENVWNHFFTVGGSNTVYYETGSDMAYIYDTGNQDVRTEGMSYGMMICVQLGHQTEFDKLWRWAKTYMQYKSGNDKEGLFAWQCNTDGSIKGTSCAPDGEAYFLTALFFASHRWGNDGDINYEEEAQYLIKEILDKPGRSAGSVSPIFNMSNYLITFGETSYGFSDPSYNLPGFWELWARWTDTNKSFWAKTPSAARDLLYNSAHATTGLYPDYSEFDGTPYYPSWAGYDTRLYKYDAIRCPMNVGMDYHWFAADTRQQTMMYNILNFFKNDGYSHAYFNIDGSGADGYYSEGQKGANGVGTFALTSANSSLAKEHLQNLWNTNAPTGTYRYYNGMVYMLSMLHASGNFRIFKPTPEVIEQNLSGPAPVEFNGEEFTEDTTFKKLIDCKIYDVTITIEESSKYVVTFVDHDGTELKSEEVASGESATAPTEPTREGYDFTGWDTEFENVTSDLTITATYTIKTFTVSFVDWDDSEIKTQEVDYGKAATAPENPERTGYTFKEWDADYSIITEDLTVTAIYTINSYTVSFVDFDGTTLKEETVEHGNDATAPDNPSRDGYTFAGWDSEFENVTSDLTITATYNKKDAGLKYEAENAQGSGTQTVSNSNASGGKYVKMQEGSLTFTVSVETAGIYDISIIYSLTEDYKAQNIEVNGSTAGTISFNQSGSTTPTFASTTAAVSLNAGTNTIAITKSWGWVDVDYIELSSHERVVFTIADELVTPNPQPATVQVYEFMKDNFQKKTISGVMTLDMLDGSGNPISVKDQTDVSYIYQKSGKYTALVGFDFMQSVGKGTEWATTYTQSMIAMVKELWNDGGIPYFTWHWRDPTKTTDSFNSSGVSFNLTDAFTDASCTTWNTNSALYKGIIEDLDVIAEHLLDLQCAGVSVLWRPLHEASGEWFWWGASGATAYKQLYYLLFDRLINYYGLHNLIWVWNSDGTDADWYPGEDYIDIVGRDFYYSSNTYNHSSLVTEFEAVAEIVDGKKIVSLAECGAVPYPDNMHADGAVWSWFMPWYDEGDTKYVSSSDHNTAADWNSIMNDERVITLEDMTGWDNRTKLYDTTKAEVLYSKHGFSVTPTEVGDFDYEKTFTSSLGCDSTVVLYLNVTEADVKTYTVTFVDYDDTQIDEQIIEEGKDATPPTSPTRDGFVFAGWDGSYTNITDDVTIKATYTEKDKADYTALNAAIVNAESIETEHYSAASVETLQAALTDAKAVDKDLYAEDQNVVDEATATLTAALNALVIKTFTVTFVDFDDSEIDKQIIEYGQDATAPTDPTRDGYSFAGWDGSFTNVTTELTIKAIYTENDKADYTALNTAITEAEKLSESEYSSSTWTNLQSALTNAKAVDKNLYATDQDIVDDATTALNTAISALIKIYTVTFVDGQTNTEIEIQKVEYGKSATAPTIPTHDNYTFSSWDKDFSNITEDITITALFTENNKADYTALNTAIVNAESIETEHYSAASVEALQAALTDAKAVDKNLYVEDQNVVDEATTALTAALNALVIKTFTVTFVDFDDSEIDQQIIEYGQDATAPTDPTRDGFTFSGWSAEYTNITSDITITALYTENGKADYTALNAAITKAENLETIQYTTETVEALQVALTDAKAVDKNLYVEDQNVVDEATTALTTAFNALVIKTFTVTFVDFDDSEINQQIIEYGQNAMAPTDPTRDGYTFSGWDGTYTNITDDVTIKAIYTEKDKADYTALNAVIVNAESIETEHYSAASVETLQAALTDAKAVDKELYAEDQNVVDEATAALTAALKALVIKTFTVTFVDFDDSEIDQQIIEYGQDATAPTDPTRDGYSFAGWDGPFTNVTTELTIKAIYTENDKADYTALNTAITEAEKLSESKYSSSTWTNLQSALTNAKAVDKNLYATDQDIVDDATTTLTTAISALIKIYTVTFVDWDNTKLDEQIIEEGGSATPPMTPTREGYDFVNWSGHYTNVTADATITATYIIKGKADYSALDRVIASTQNLQESKYSPDSWTILQQALATAQAVDRDLYSESQSIVNAAQEQLENAINTLVLLDRSSLSSAISEANTLYKNSYEGNNKGQYPTGSKEVLQNAIIKAKTTYDANSVSQSDIDIATAELNQAIIDFKALVITVDKTQLLYLIEKAQTTLAKADNNTGDGSGQYPYSAVETFTNAINAAQGVYTISSLQDEVNGAAISLMAAISEFEKSVNPYVEIVDKTELIRLVTEADSLLNNTANPANHFLEYVNLATAKSNATTVCENTQTTQSSVNIQIRVLQEAIDKFKDAFANDDTAIDEIENNALHVYTTGHTIIVENAEGSSIEIYATTGSKIAHIDSENVVSKVEIPITKVGVYFVKVGSTSRKVIVR